MDGGVVVMQVQDLVITEVSIGVCVHGNIWSQRIRKLYPSKNIFFLQYFQSEYNIAHFTRASFPDALLKISRQSFTV